MHHIAVDDVHKFSLSAVIPVCATLHSPTPISDTALTLMMYSVPASSPIRIVEVAGSETERVVALFQDVDPLLLYSTWYWEMVRSLWGGVQDTFSVGLPCLTILDRDTLVTWEGTCKSRVCRELIRTTKTPFHDVHGCMCNSIPMPQLVTSKI